MFRNTKNRFLIISVIFLLFWFCFPKNVFAFFSEEFDKGILSEDTKWKLLDEDKTLEHTDDTFHFTAPKGKHFPYLFTKTPVFPDTPDFSVKLRFQYDNKSYDFGTGICITDSTPQERTDYEIPTQNGLFWIWPSTNKTLRIWATVPNSDGISRNSCVWTGEGDEFYSQHKVEINYKNRTYQVFVDDNLCFTSGKTSERPNFLWIGNPVNFTHPTWSKFQVDYIRISEIGSPPLILLPGLGASWNTRAMVYRDTVDNDQWKMTPFVNIYNRFIETAKNNGYAQGDNFFVWNYDWRKSIPEITVDLNSFIESKPSLKNSEEIDFVGHSLGGLVARTWSQSHGEKVGRLVTVGSPHKGAVQAYEALAGGKTGDKVDIGWLATQLLLQIHCRGFETNAEVIRNLAPVLQDINPTFDFIKKYRRQIPVNQTAYFNNFLNQLNQNQNILGFSHFILGNTGKTVPEWLFVKNRSSLDEILDLWPDGKITKIINGIGDGTVLKKSAFLGGGSDLVLEYADLNHRQLINNQNTVVKIFEILGNSGVIVSGPDAYPDNDLLIFYLASPATLKVNSLSSDDDDLQFVVIPNPDGDYDAEITGTDNGKYHLYLGQITPSGNFWQTYEGQIEKNETKNYRFAIDFSNPLPDPLIDENGSNHLTQAKELLEDLIQEDNNQNLSRSLEHLNSAIGFANQKNWSQEINKIKNSIYYLSRFRRKLGDSQILSANKAQRIMEILAAGWENVLKNQNLDRKQNAYREYRRARGYYSLAMRLMRLSKRRRNNIPKIKAIFVKQSEDLINDIKKDWRAKNYSSVETQSYLARLFAWEGFVNRR